MAADVAGAAGHQNRLPRCHTFSLPIAAQRLLGRGAPAEGQAAKRTRRHVRLDDLGTSAPDLLFTDSMLKAGAIAGMPRREPSRSRGRALCLALGLSGLVALTACAGPQSALDPAGAGAERIADLFWVMLAGAVLIWLLVIGAVVYAIRTRPHRHAERAASALLLWGGLVVPTVVLAGLADLGPRADGRPARAGRRLRDRRLGRAVVVAGRLSHARRDAPVASANEVRLPRGQRVEIELTSPDVIHAFWIPSIAGKVDMIPGRVNRLVVEPTRTGAFRGVCAEFCGESHALMAFSVEVMEPPSSSMAGAAGRGRGPARRRLKRRAARAVRPGRLRRLPCGARHRGRGRDRPGPHPSRRAAPRSPPASCRTTAQP